MNKDASIFVAGHRGMVGSALVRRLQAGGYTQVLTASRQELDLLDQRAVHVGRAPDISSSQIDAEFSKDF